MNRRGWMLATLWLLLGVCAPAWATGEDAPPQPLADVEGAVVAQVEADGEAERSEDGSVAGGLLPDLNEPEGIAATLRWVALLTILSLAPAVLVMVTSFTRIIVVLGLLRQAIAAQHVPPNPVLFGLAVLMTVTVMAPVYRQVHADALGPYFANELTGEEALPLALAPVREFMIHQLENAGNTEDVYLFLDDETASRDGLTWGEVPTLALVPAFVISELKVAFLIGLRIFLPFVVIDMLVSGVLVSMGMLMLPPVLISLPFKLLLFVLADGWRLVIGSLMRSFT